MNTGAAAGAAAELVGCAVHTVDEGAVADGQPDFTQRIQTAAADTGPVPVKGDVLNGYRGGIVLCLHTNSAAVARLVAGECAAGHLKHRIGLGIGGIADGAAVALSHVILKGAAVHIHLARGVNGAAAALITIVSFANPVIADLAVNNGQRALVVNSRAVISAHAEASELAAVHGHDAAFIDLHAAAAAGASQAAVRHAAITQGECGAVLHAHGRHALVVIICQGVTVQTQNQIAAFHDVDEFLCGYIIRKEKILRVLDIQIRSTVPRGKAPFRMAVMGAACLAAVVVLVGGSALRGKLPHLLVRREENLAGIGLGASDRFIDGQAAQAGACLHMDRLVGGRGYFDGHGQRIFGVCIIRANRTLDFRNGFHRQLTAIDVAGAGRAVLAAHARVLSLHIHRTAVHIDPADMPFGAAAAQRHGCIPRRHVIAGIVQRQRAAVHVQEADAVALGFAAVHGQVFAALQIQRAVVHYGGRVNMTAVHRAAVDGQLAAEPVVVITAAAFADIVGRHRAAVDHNIDCAALPTGTDGRAAPAGAFHGDRAAVEGNRAWVGTRHARCRADAGAVAGLLNVVRTAVERNVAAIARAADSSRRAIIRLRIQRTSALEVHTGVHRHTESREIAAIAAVRRAIQRIISGHSHIRRAALQIHSGLRHLVRPDLHPVKGDVRRIARAGIDHNPLPGGGHPAGHLHRHAGRAGDGQHAVFVGVVHTLGTAGHHQLILRVCIAGYTQHQQHAQDPQQLLH